MQRNEETMTAVDLETVEQEAFESEIVEPEWDAAELAGGEDLDTESSEAPLRLGSVTVNAGMMLNGEVVPIHGLSVALDLDEDPVGTLPQIGLTLGGTFTFPGVAVGAHVVSFPAYFTAGDSTYQAVQSRVSVVVEAGRPVTTGTVFQPIGPAVVVGMAPDAPTVELHRIYGPCRPPAITIVELYPAGDNAGRPELVTLVSNGCYELFPAEAGFYEIVGKTATGREVVRSVVKTSSPTPFELAADIAAETTAYPILTEEVSTSGTGSPTSGGAGTTDLSRQVDAALQQVLGWRPRVSDPKSFAAALQNSFTITPFEGRVNVTWTPKNYASTISADLGAITGAQASLYARGQSINNQLQPLLDGLTALRSDPDYSDMEAVRAVVRVTVQEIADEFGNLGGPRFARVDQLFKRLGATPKKPQDITTATKWAAICNHVQHGQLNKLLERFGLVIANVNTIDDEQDLTNFLIVLDCIADLESSWKQFKTNFAPGASNPWFGTQLVLIARALAVTSELVDDLEFALDSVFIGNDERYTTNLVFTSHDDMWLGDLLDWLTRFARTEGRELLEDSGKDGGEAFKETTEELNKLVNDASNAYQVSRGNAMPPGYRTPRVHRAISSLSNQINSMYTLSQAIKSPF